MSRANRHDGGCGGQSETASFRSREGPPRDQAHGGECDFDSKQMRGLMRVFVTRATGFVVGCVVVQDLIRSGSQRAMRLPGLASSEGTRLSLIWCATM